MTMRLQFPHDHLPRGTHHVRASWIMYCILLLSTCHLAQAQAAMTVRLSNGNKTDTYINGALEISLSGGQSWMSVCDYYFHQDEGNPACRMLGFQKGEVITSSLYPSSNQPPPPYEQKFVCTGSESSLEDCTIADDDPCIDVEADSVSLLCYNESEDVLEMRLSQGIQDRASVRGRLEVRLPGLVWGSVCDDLFNTAAATAACHNLGYKYGEPEDSQRGGNPPHILLDDVLCTAGQSFLDCDHDQWGRHDCTNYEDVWLFCTNDAVRLVSAVSKEDHVGSVEMFVKGEGWYEVCDENWSDVEARVACKELGYVDGKALCCNALGATSYGSISFAGTATNVRCKGDEASLSSCQWDETHVCNFKQDVLQLASTICYDKPVDQINMNLSVSLVSDSNLSGGGLFQLRYMGVDGIICDDDGTFDDKESDVACRMLGEGYIGGRRSNANFTKPEAWHTWLRSVNCTGNEKSLEDCNISAWGLPAHGYCESPVSILCYKQELKLTLSRQPGSDKDTGILQISYDGQVGSVCADHWTTYEANTACRSLGYNGGQVWALPQNSSPVGVSSSFFLSGVVCPDYDLEDDFYMCNSDTWGISTQACQQKPSYAGVSCINSLKLEPGENGKGVVQVYTEDGWYPICLQGFDEKAADVVCKQLGYTYSTPLPFGSFGFVESEPLSKRVRCNGTENSIMECTFDHVYCNYRDYASVSCYNRTLETPDGTISFEDGFENLSEATGILKIQLNNTLMYFCDEFFSDYDADVACQEYGRSKQLSYKGGVRFHPKEKLNAPFLTSHLQCNGTEHSILECVGHLQVCYHTMAATVLCYSTEAPKLQIQGEGGSIHSGHLQISINGQLGAICADSWDDDDAAVACLSMNEMYRGGQATKLKASGLPWFMSSFDCFGQETSLLECEASKWRRLNDSYCKPGAMEAGVICFTSVSLIQGNFTNDYIYGSLDVKLYSTSYEVCHNSLFTYDLAQRTCSELGFEHSSFLHPASLVDEYYVMKNIVCLEEQKSISKCRYRIGYCSPYYGGVQLMCYKNKINALRRWKIENNSYGRLVTEDIDMAQFVGSTCRLDWSDKDADTVCKEKGFKGGKALGAMAKKTAQEPKEIMWFGSLTCETDGNGKFCTFAENANIKCIRGNEIFAAGVLCHTNDEGIRFRLMDHNNEARYAGRVEIKYNGAWGTVCNKRTDRQTAVSLCKQMGFEDGTVLRPALKKYGRGTGPIYLKDVSCSTSDKYFLGCPSAEGWNSATNCTHNDDLEVICYPDVRLFPNAENSYGAVGKMLNNHFVLVCKTGFTDTEAQVVCRELGYTTGKSICCQFNATMTDSPLEIGIGELKCSGTEANIGNCSYYEVTPGDCYAPASVACSYSTSPNDEYALSLSEGSHGILKLTYLGVEGDVCADEFNHADASVMCKELGYFDGFAIEDLRRRVGRLVWPFKAECKGTETKLSACPGLDFDFTKNLCHLRQRRGYYDSVYRIGSVHCLTSSDGLTGNVRLTGSKFNHEGRVEIQIQGVWGTINSLDYHDYAGYLHNVICNQLGFRGGQSLPRGTFGIGPEKFWFSRVSCEGNETNILQCNLENRTDFQFPGKTVAVECFQGVKLENSPVQQPERGELVIKAETDKKWRNICDTGISDTEATVACRGLGYTNGKKLCCSPGGYKEDNISVTSIKCNGNENDILKCTINRQGVCSTNNTAYIQCGHHPFSNENLTVSSMNDFVGIPKATVYDIQGGICGTDLEDKEATVICKELGFNSGILLKPKKMERGELVVITSLRCHGSEQRISQCTYDSLKFEDGCPDRLAAQVLCKESDEPVTFRMSSVDVVGSGKAEIVIDRVPYYVSIFNINAYAASVFCNSMSNTTYAHGDIVNKNVPGDLDGRVLMASVSCRGDEKNLFYCNAVYLPRYQRVSASDVAYIQCHKNVELEGGSSLNSGVLTTYNKKLGYYGSFCSTGFGQKETDVACRSLNYDFGIKLCCGSYGFSYLDPLFKSVQCSGNEKTLLDCKHVASTRHDEYLCNPQQYVEVACFNGTKAKDFKVSLKGPGTHTKVGFVQIDYMNVSGNICPDEWDDKDATVACKEFGFTSGISYTHYKSPFEITKTAGPYWISNVECSGNEARLADCTHSGVGNVQSCSQRHHAGVLCSYRNEFAFRIAGTTKPHYGRVEVKIDGVWGTICDRGWDSKDATVLCRQMGYISGDVFDTEKLQLGTGPVYEISPWCLGNETSLNGCPHSGWISDKTASCARHTRDAGVFCYTSVRLATGAGKSSNNGPVMLYDDEKWYKVCDEGFNDMTARKVCQELGFFDGKWICCSAYEGESTIDGFIHPNTSLSCSSESQTIDECKIYDGDCKSNSYASAICFEETETPDDKDYSFAMKGGFSNSGQLVVNHYGVQGRICSSNWTDVDATVFCRHNGVPSGIAYYHSFKQSYESAASIGPFWVSQMTCTGNESSLAECPFNSREKLGNCSAEHTASVVCYRNDGIRYRFSGGGSRPNRGRVEMSLDQRWGTICDQGWDNNDAKVVCREQGYSDGLVQSNSEYGRGSGPIWLNNVECTGSESALHQCPHTGFEDRERSNNFSPFLFGLGRCTNHKYDAAVFCFKDTRLNLSLNQTSGGLLFYEKNEWRPVCGKSFSKENARVACKGLLEDFVDGLPVPDERFGKIDGDHANSFSCSGSEKSLGDCPRSNSGDCKQGTYASVACFKKTLTDEDMKFQLRLSSDSLRTSDDHGILEVRLNGVWGRICMHDFTDKEATVACKTLGFTGGNVYLHFFRNLLPIWWSKLKCLGTENSLKNCDASTKVDNENCAFNSNDAGVLCYNTTGIQYRLSKQSSGRVEIGLEKGFGSVCRINWSTANSKVLCRYLGYKDGIPLHDKDRSLPTMSILMSFFLCRGNEKTLLACLNSGFDSGENSFLCGGDAYAACYQEEVRVTKIRLQDGGTSAEGRVEVYVEPLNEWGTVCDDRWSHLNAKVVCRELGYSDGIDLRNVQPGTGKIFLDNVVCNGTESELMACNHSGINYHNCDHQEDAGVQCFHVTTPSPTPSVATMKPSISSPHTTPTHSTLTRLPTSITKLHTTETSPTPTPKRTTPTPKPTPRFTSSSSPEPTSAPTTTPTETTSETTVVTGQRASSSQEDDKVVPAISATVAIIAVVAIIVVVCIIYRKRHQPKSSFSHERFENETMEESNDGSVAISNRMYGIENPTDDPMSSYMADGTEIRLDRSGYASFSKGSPPVGDDENLPDGFSNPLYAVQNQNGAGLEDVKLDMNNKEDITLESSS